MGFPFLSTPSSKTTPSADHQRYNVRHYSRQVTPFGDAANTDFVPLFLFPPPDIQVNYDVTTRVALYARVSTSDQNCELQLRDLRDYVSRRVWIIAGEFIDHGVSGAKDSRPS
jgi:hypothetical protein